MEMNYAMIRARISEAADGGERRRADRLPVMIDARVRALGEEGSEARIVNISEKGFMAQVSGVYEVGSRVWLMLPGRERSNAVVRWIAGDKIGAEFAEPVTLSALR
jgi:hypothetical protein